MVIYLRHLLKVHISVRPSPAKGITHILSLFPSYLYICNELNFSFVFLNASDLDVGKNCLLEYTIMDEEAKKYFHIDSSTGTIKLLQSVDYESKQSFKFNVIVSELKKEFYLKKNPFHFNSI